MRLGIPGVCGVGINMNRSPRLFMRRFYENPQTFATLAKHELDHDARLRFLDAPRLSGCTAQLEVVSHWRGCRDCRQLALCRL